MNVFFYKEYKTDAVTLFFYNIFLSIWKISISLY